MDWLRLPKKVYFKRGSTPVALRELSEVYGMKRAFIVADADEYNAGITRPIEKLLAKQGIRHAGFSNFDSDLSFEDAYKGLAKLQSLKPDAVIGIGSETAMTMARLMAILAEAPDTDLDALAEKHSSIADYITDFPYTAEKVQLVLLPAVNKMGTAPIASAKTKDGNKISMMDFAMLPLIAVIDPDNAKLISEDVIKKNISEIRDLASKIAEDENTSEYVVGFAEDAVASIDENLPLIDEGNGASVKAMENLANAAAIAGIAIANTQ